VNNTDHTKKLLTSYLRRLTNLTGNNRSIFLPRLLADQCIDVQEFSFLNGESAFAIINALIANQEIILCRLADARMEAVNNASRKLKKLQRIDEFIFEEKGSKDLHVGWPFVEGKFKDGTLVRCPLLYFPVALTISNNQWVLRPRKEADITFNKTFLLAYAFYNQFKANEELLEETFEDIDSDSTVFRTRLYQLLQQHEIEINFNADNYRDELTAFTTIKRDEFEETHKNGELKLFPNAVLGIFPQAGSNLVPDYLQLIDNTNFQDLEGFFHARTTEDARPSSLNFLQLVKEEKMHPVFPLDIWQENAMKAAKLGHSFVVQGPPGTGKSQLICNLISDAIAMGKRVLVVCQKRVALDVVYQRMSAHLLGEYIALVHDFKTDRKPIYAKVASQIEKVDEYRQKNISLDTIQLERKFLQLCHRIDQVVEELETYKHALFDETECGINIKDLYLKSDPRKEVINVKQEFHHFKFDTIDDSLRKFKLYLHYAGKLYQPEYIWRDRKSFSGFEVSDLQAIIQTIKEVNQVFQHLSELMQSTLGVSLDFQHCEQILEKQNQASDIRILLKDEIVYSYFQKMASDQEPETSGLWLSNVEKNLMSCFEGEGPEISTPTAQLGTLQKALHRSMKARRSLFGLIRWELFSKDKFLIKRALVFNELNGKRAGFKTLERKLDNRLNLEHNLTKLREKEWLIDIPESLTQKDFIRWFANQHFAMNTKINFSEIRGIKNIIDPSKISLTEFQQKIDQLFSLLATISEHKVAWSNYLTQSQINYITTLPDNIPHLIQELRSDFDALCEFDRLNENLSNEEKSILKRLNEHTQSWDAEILLPLLYNSLCVAWIEHLEIKHPELRMVSSGKITLLENELRELHREKQKLSEEIVLLRARENVIDELKFNRLNNRVTYRDLLHQVTKKKKIWPIRKLITAFEEEIFKLVPCWLASPESVSAIFPMTDLFDLVIFDEASQCFAEQGIPALYRGKQVVIAGDSKQLRPGDFYQARWEDEDFEHPDTEVDSLLELTSRYLMNVQLKGHYRSKTPELIAFSNQYFYKSSLQFLPDRHALNHTEPVMIYEKLDGVWENNTNIAEAHRVAELVSEITQQQPDKHIGVITFNAPQQSLILDLLEEKFNQAHHSIPDTVFVKNIENVQGDESDIIIFSIGYAADTKGRVHAQFGSLNMSGGENRLNVAVSRAREKIILVTSIWPEQLSVEGTINEGPKLLKKYLQFVFQVSNNTFKILLQDEAKKTTSHYLRQEIKNWVVNKWPEYSIQDSYLPYFDLLVTKEGSPQGALFTDDNSYQQSMSVKADHAIYPDLLELKNWPYLRVYTRNWWQDPDKFFNEISKFLTQ
jgi:hypothetical protein